MKRWLLGWVVALGWTVTSLGQTSVAPEESVQAVIDIAAPGHVIFLPQGE